MEEKDEKEKTFKRCLNPHHTISYWQLGWSSCTHDEMVQRHKYHPGLKTLGELWISFDSLILNHPLRCDTQPFWGKIQKLAPLFQRGKFCLWPSLLASWSISALRQSSTSEFKCINLERILQLSVVKISLTRVTLYHYTYFPFLCSLFLYWRKQNSPL